MSYLSWRKPLAAPAAMAVLSAALFSSAQAQEVVLYGAGSLRPVLTAIAQGFTAKTGTPVRSEFGPSGLMRSKIESGDAVDLFASADMEHVLKLKKDGRAVQVVMFTRNRLCAFARPDLGMTPTNFVARMLDPVVKLGTSTPKADPGGDYTWEMFRLLDKESPGAFALLDQKAQKIVGGTTAVDPNDPNPIASAFERGQINVMMGYCSGTAQRLQDTPGLQAIQVPSVYAPAPEYGLAVMRLDKPAAVQLALDILSPEGQKTLQQFGFAPMGAQQAAP